MCMEIAVTSLYLGFGRGLCWSAIFPLQSMSCNSQHTVKSCRYRDFLYRALTMTLVKHSQRKKTPGCPNASIQCSSGLNPTKRRKMDRESVWYTKKINYKIISFPRAARLRASLCPLRPTVVGSTVDTVSRAGIFMLSWSKSRLAHFIRGLSV